MTQAPIYIPENCYRVTIVREFRAAEIRLFFRFDLPNNTHAEDSRPLENKEQAEAIKALFDGWSLIESDVKHQVYERDAR